MEIICQVQILEAIIYLEFTDTQKHVNCKCEQSLEELVQEYELRTFLKWYLKEQIFSLWLLKFNPSEYCGVVNIY